MKVCEVEAEFSKSYHVCASIDGREEVEKCVLGS